MRMIKTILYIFSLIMTIWAMDGLDLNRFFKQNRVYQARLIYLMLAMSISYLVTNFIYDFVISFQIIK